MLLRGRRSSCVLWALAASVLLAGVAFLHFRWIATHFSSDGYLLDSGWFAYLFGSGDPLLRNPSAVNGLSFYAHHLSPHIFLFGAPLVAVLRLNGIEIFSLHQAVFHAVFLLSLVILIASSAPLGRAVVSGAAGISIGALANPIWQSAAYPHYEIALIALVSTAITAYAVGYRTVAACCLLWLPVVREDGGLYAAFVCLACAIVVHWGQGWNADRKRLFVWAGFGVLASVVTVWLKTWGFPGFDTFSGNFSGDSWSHVSVEFLGRRIWSLLTNPDIVPVLVGSLVLSRFDVRYLTGIVLLSPLFMLHLMSVREEHGQFTLYYALPWLLPCVLWLVVFVLRERVSRRVSALESTVLLVSSLLLAAPAQATLGIPGNFWYVARWAVERPVVPAHHMIELARRMRAAPVLSSQENRLRCVSVGVAALIPNDIAPEDLVQPGSNLSACSLLVLLRGDMHYGPLWQMARNTGFEHVSGWGSLELWFDWGLRR